MRNQLVTFVKLSDKPGCQILDCRVAKFKFLNFDLSINFIIKLIKCKKNWYTAFFSDDKSIGDIDGMGLSLVQYKKDF